MNILDATAWPQNEFTLLTLQRTASNPTYATAEIVKTYPMLQHVKIKSTPYATADEVKPYPTLQHTKMKIAHTHTH